MDALSPQSSMVEPGWGSQSSTPATLGHGCLIDTFLYGAWKHFFRLLVESHFGV